MITPKNCLCEVEKIMRNRTVNNVNRKAAQWKCVFEWCIENGMKTRRDTTVIEDVIGFLSQLKNT